MAIVNHVWVKRDTITETKIVSLDRPELGDNQLRVEIDKFALTSNNVTYAVSGDFIGYWKFYPAQGEWGNVTVWGFANVIETNANDIPIGTRLYGFFPMASETVLTVGKRRETSFMDATPHRQELPALYNQYRLTGNDPEFLQDMEDEQCIFLPLFGTSFILYDYLHDNGFFGAEQIAIGSVSSKTGFGLAKLLKADPSFKGEIIGITSEGNAAFVGGLGCCDQVITYGHEAALDPTKRTAYIDMSGNSVLTRALHKHIGENVVESCMVGATHWEKMGNVKDLPGAKPTLFFAPAQVSKRNKEWGVGVMMDKATAASIDLAREVADQITIERVQGAEDLADMWKAMVSNQVSPKRGIMVSLS